MIVQICVGSSCHLKGSEKVVELFRDAIGDYHVEAYITMIGCFCTGKCNREGVTVSLDTDVYTGVTPENFKDFFENTVLPALKIERYDENGVPHP